MGTRVIAVFHDFERSLELLNVASEFAQKRLCEPANQGGQMSLGKNCPKFSPNRNFTGKS
jgi:hypothetical protein